MKKKHRLIGDWLTKQVLLDGKVLNPARSQRCHNHSPDGFNWAYGGSGPAQLALAIMLECTGIPEGYHEFTDKFIATLPATNFDVEFEL